MVVGVKGLINLPRNLVTVIKLFLPNVKKNVSQIRSAMLSLMKFQPLLITLTATVIKTEHTPLEAVGPIRTVTY